MAYQRSEYHREVQRDTEDRDNKTGGWRSWFGLDNKDDEDRGYKYQSTATYRNPQHPSYYERTSYPERGYYGQGYSGPRGGYGYTTSDEVSRGPWTADRDYTTRPSYGQTTGDRDVYYKQETRTYGGDRGEWTRPTGGDWTSRSYTPSRGYGYERDYPTTYPTTTTSRDYPTTTTSRDYPTSTYGRGYTSDYPTTTTGRGYTSYERDYPTTSRGYTSYDRDYPTTSRGGYGFSGDYTSNKYTNGGYRGDYHPRETTGYTGGESTYTRPSYQPSTYRY